jgi:hypothetical protein
MFGEIAGAADAIGVDKVDEAQRALSDHLIEWKVSEKAFAGAMSSQLRS